MDQPRSNRFPLHTLLPARVLDVTACFPDGSIEVRARIGQSDVLVRLTRAQAIEADILDRQEAKW